MRKLMLLVGAGIGYVLGARAGRERYEQITEQANKVWGDPRVQTRVEDVRQQAPQVASKMTGSARGAADRAKSKVSGHESTDQDGSYDNPTGSLDPDGTATVDTSGFGPGEERLP
ncbi:YtxH domain-containing protein [Ornithinicoccus halotolerans]|uniref:YtxH domain-containing protein n=1 Tax=Ornithinicoccus halotolerans TaxID=1748220 RepID=UPI0018861B87|nr:YtxH domain-containing protein [Ornithinicoccus halotolerans]